MKRSLRRRTRGVRHWLLGAGARAFLLVVWPLPFAVTRRLFPLLTRIVAYPILRKSITHNLVLALGDDLDAAARTRIAKRVSRNIGLIVAEILGLVRNKLPDGYIDYAALARVDAKIGPDTGFVNLTAHTGNWECMAWCMFAHWKERAGAVIVRQQGNPEINAIVQAARTRLGVVTLYHNESPRRALRLLQQGLCVATAPDQDIARVAGVFIPFFGRKAYTPVGPATLAYLANVPIVPGFARRTRDGIVLDCPDPIWPDTSAPREAEIERLTRAWSDLVEAHIRAHPSDWMWFHGRWHTTPQVLAARREKLRRRSAVT